MRMLLVLQDNTRVTLSTSQRGVAALIASVYGNPFVSSVCIAVETSPDVVHWCTIWTVDVDSRTFKWFYSYEDLCKLLLNGEQCAWLRVVVPEHDGRKTIAIEDGINAMWRRQAEAWNFS